MNVLTLHAKRLATRRQQMNLPRSPENGLYKGRYRPHDVLTIVDYQQHSPVSQELQQTRGGVAAFLSHAERGRHHAGDERLIAQIDEVDEAHFVDKFCERGVTHGNSQRGFPHAARTDDAHEACFHQRLGNALDFAIATNHRRQRQW